jgi:ribosome maturation protein SDO1
MQNRTYDKERVSFTLARLKKGGENFEVVISNVDKALAFRLGNEIKLSEFVQSQTVFENANKGLKASEDKIKSILGETPVAKVIRDGELHLTADQRKKLMETRRNRIIEYIQQNSVDPKSGSPHPRQRIELAMAEAKVNVDISENIDVQTQKIIKSIMTIIPLSFDKIKLKITIPAKFAGSTYSALKNRYSSSMKKEEWQSDGGIYVELEIVGGAKNDIYSLINKLTNGEAEINE